MTNVRYLLTLLFALCALWLMLAVVLYGYQRSDEIASTPCLGCLGLNPAQTKDFQFNTVMDKPTPDYIKELLRTGVVFLHFRIIVCPACDEVEEKMFNPEASGKDIQKDYPDVHFIHSNLEIPEDLKGLNITLTQQEQRTLYTTYDVSLEKKGKSGGVPLMVIITLNKNDATGNIEPYFISLYGSDYSKADIEDRLDPAEVLHHTYIERYSVD